MNLKKTTKYIFRRPVSGFFNYLLKYFNVFIIYRIGSAVGDQLCMSAVVRLIDQQHSFKIVVISSYPEIFDNNPRVWKNIGIKRYSLYVSRALRFLSGIQLENFLFKDSKCSFEEYMRSSKKKQHLVEVHSRHFNHRIDYNEIQNEIYLSRLEIERCAEKFNMPDFYSIIQPNSKKSYTPNKQWGLDNFQKVVNDRHDTFWVQIGSQDEFLLKNVEDFRGRTTLRELFYIVSQSQFVFANEGLVNHVASAFNIKSYVISSGFSDTSLAEYDSSIFFNASDSCDRSPCWLLNECKVIGKPCLSSIHPGMVSGHLL